MIASTGPAFREHRLMLAGEEHRRIDPSEPKEKEGGATFKVAGTWIRGNRYRLHWSRGDQAHAPVGGIRPGSRPELATVANLCKTTGGFRRKGGEATPDSVGYYDSQAAVFESKRADNVAVCVRVPIAGLPMHVSLLGEHFAISGVGRSPLLWRHDPDARRQFPCHRPMVHV